MLNNQHTVKLINLVKFPLCFLLTASQLMRKALIIGKIIIDHMTEEGRKEIWI